MATREPVVYREFVVSNLSRTAVLRGRLAGRSPHAFFLVEGVRLLLGASNAQTRDMNRAIEASLRAVAALVGVALAAGTALAHPGGHGGTELRTGLIGVVLFGVGLGIFGVTTAVERVRGFESRLTDVGVTLGLLTVAVGAFVYWY